MAGCQRVSHHLAGRCRRHWLLSHPHLTKADETLWEPTVGPRAPEHGPRPAVLPWSRGSFGSSGNHRMSELDRALDTMKCLQATYRNLKRRDGRRLVKVPYTVMESGLNSCSLWSQLRALSPQLRCIPSSHKLYRIHKTTSENKM